MNSKSNHIEFVHYDNAKEMVDQHFKSPLLRYLSNLETSMRESDFIFDSVQLLY